MMHTVNIYVLNIRRPSKMKHNPSRYEPAIITLEHRFNSAK